VVHHLGERDDVPSLLAASDLMLQPSHHEGFPLTVSEALCAEVPILAADAPGLRWLEAMESATLLPLEQGVWAARIAESIREGEGPATLRRCSSLAQARFGAARGVAEYVAAYRSALEASPFLLRPPNRRAPDALAS